MPAQLFLVVAFVHQSRFTYPRRCQHLAAEEALAITGSHSERVDRVSGYKAFSKCFTRTDEIDEWCT